jgi:hypothetical protein
MATGFSYGSSLSVKSQGIDQVIGLPATPAGRGWFRQYGLEANHRVKPFRHHQFESIECASQSGRGTLDTPAT